MQLHKLSVTVEKRTRRLGRGSGSGRGKTSGRGTKGQKARGSIKPGFEGGQLRLLKRMPFNRGKNRNDSRGVKPFILNVEALNSLPSGKTVTVAVLVESGFFPKEAIKYGVKILGGGELTKKLNLAIPCSKEAVKKIEKAGGTVSFKKAEKSE